MLKVHQCRPLCHPTIHFVNICMFTKPISIVNVRMRVKVRIIVNIRIEAPGTEPYSGAVKAPVM